MQDASATAGADLALARYLKKKMAAAVVQLAG
jgi:hypothetical protein